MILTEMKRGYQEKAFIPAPSRRRGVRMQQVVVYEDDYAGEYLHHAARRAARKYRSTRRYAAMPSVRSST